MTPLKHKPASHPNQRNAEVTPGRGHSNQSIRRTPFCREQRWHPRPGVPPGTPSRDAPNQELAPQASWMNRGFFLREAGVYLRLCAVPWVGSWPRTTSQIVTVPWDPGTQAPKPRPPASRDMWWKGIPWGAATRNLVTRCKNWGTRHWRYWSSGGCGDGAHWLEGSREAVQRWFSMKKGKKSKNEEGKKKMKE